MITKPSDIRNVRPIAENINDPARLEPYIKEAETLRLVDLLGASLYKWLDETDFSGVGPFTFIRDDGKEIAITKEQLTIIMDGGYYTDTCGKGQMTEGLKVGVAYLVYSRFVMNNPINPTAFGVRYKNGEFSTEVEDQVLARASSEARKIGEAYLYKAVAYLKTLNLLPCCATTSKNPSYSIVIKHNKL